MNTLLNARANTCPARLGSRASLKRQAASIYEQLQAADQSDFFTMPDSPLGSWPRVRQRPSPAMSVFELSSAFAEHAQQSGQDVTDRLGNELSRIHLPHDAEEHYQVNAVQEGCSYMLPDCDPSCPSAPQTAFSEEAQLKALWKEAQLKALMDLDEIASMCETDDRQTDDAINELLAMMGEAPPQQQHPTPQQPQQPPQPQPTHHQTHEHAGAPAPAHASHRAADVNESSFSMLLPTSAEVVLPSGAMVSLSEAGLNGQGIPEVKAIDVAHESTMVQPLTADPLMLMKPIHLGARNARERKEWSSQEDQLILDGVAEFGCRWRKIAARLPGRSDDAVRNRWNRLKRAANVGTNDCSEDASTKRRTAMVATPLETGGELSSGETKRVEHLGWTHQEDTVIMSLVNECGPRWRQIAKHLPTRTEHAIRNRWHRLQKMHQAGVLFPHALQADVHLVTCLWQQSASSIISCASCG